MAKKIVVFAGNHCRKDREEYYFSLAYNTGKLLAENGYTVVTGGGPGLMNQVMKGAFQAQGETIGVCLSIAGRVQSEYMSHSYFFDSLPPRQEKLLSLADSFLSVPGGVGTMYEIMEVIARKRKKEIDRKKQLILIDDYFDKFQHLMEKIIKEGFALKQIEGLYYLVKTPQQAIKRLKKTV